jgi:hypothetical protein
MPASIETSPDCTPCVMRGRSAARLMAGLARAARPASAVAEAAAVMKRRRVRAERRPDLLDAIAGIQSRFA